ncbi:MAG: 3-dehydroquinate synthase [Terrimicrobiaceae bacterium]|nr:3-dehydroquinate synthase [Terrimicrobiaceae bacterium]
MSETGLLTVDVPLAHARYSVWIGDGLLAHIGEKIRPFHAGARVAVVTDANVAAIYGGAATSSLRAANFEPVLIVVEAGEASKRLEVVGQVTDAMISAGLDRGSMLVALGGGVVGDLAGFVAAIYYRGIPYVQIPTTVVSQVDSSVGGKTGVNAPGGKNLLGAFHHPALVLADPSTLLSLPQREFNEGFAEIIKHAAIRDPGMLDTLDPARRDGLAGLIARNVGIKARIVAADEREATGERALLNFGHTVGHAVEQAAGYGGLLHGEAISIGLHAALRLSVQKAGLPETDAARVLAALEAFDLPTRIPPGLETGAVMLALARDKKFESGRVRFVLLERLGRAFLSSAVTAAEIEAVVEDLKSPGSA